MTLSRLTCFNVRVIANWEGGLKISEPSLRRLCEIERLRDGLAETVLPDAIPHWLESANRAFGELKPLEVIERDEIDRFWQMIYGLDSGIAN